MNLLGALAIFAVVALVVVFGAVVVPDTYRDVRDALRRHDDRRKAQMRFNAAATALAVTIAKFGDTLAEVLTPALREAAVAMAQFGEAWSDWFETQSWETQEMIRHLAEEADAPGDVSWQPGDDWTG